MNDKVMYFTISDTMYTIQIFSILLSIVSSGYCQGAGGDGSPPVWMSSFISGTGIPVPGPREDPSGWCTLTKHYIETFLQVSPSLARRERLPNSAPGRINNSLNHQLIQIVTDEVSSFCVYAGISIINKCVKSEGGDALDQAHCLSQSLDVSIYINHFLPNIDRGCVSEFILLQAHLGLYCNFRVRVFFGLLCQWLGDVHRNLGYSSEIWSVL